MDIQKEQLEQVTSRERGIAQSFWLGQMNPIERGEIMSAVKEVWGGQPKGQMKYLRMCHAMLFLTQADAVWENYEQSGEQELDEMLDMAIYR